MIYKRLTHFLFLLTFLIAAHSIAISQKLSIQNNQVDKKITFGNDQIQLTLDYNRTANISSMTINGQQVVDGKAGIYSAVETKSDRYSSLHLKADPTITIAQNTINIQGIVYGDQQFTVKENWIFTVTNTDIRFSISRALSKPVEAEKLSLPVFVFKNINTWDGAYQDYGGLAWFYLFNKQHDTYGVHSSSSRFWNSKTNNGLNISVVAPGKEVAMDYSRTKDDELAFTIVQSAKEMIPRFDSGTNRRRFVRDTTAGVWAPLLLNAGTTNETITLSYFDVAAEFGRGKFEGINGDQVSAVLNTIARIGVIDKQHFGGNSWHTPYGPLCLHEQYIAQMGLAINDPHYLKGYQDCLDFYRDNAIKPSGRVWPRWAYTNEDMMPGEVTSKGFYEAQWGYLMDSNPDLVTNVSELYDQTGNLAWVKTHQASCERALDWIMKRDENHNGLVEMMTDSTRQRRGSDWIDIIWASYENAFVNAKLYHALVLWSAIEMRLGNHGKAAQYQQFSQQLKTSFNKPITQGGFWDDANNCYVHWRDKDGSIHGRNMVTPVNFMAIGYGICDDTGRTKTILDNIETQMQKEQLFFWPICMSTYGPGEGNDWQFPFPGYENGDLFLSWGAMAVKAYAGYKPELALKYVKNVLNQYAKDGLAFQRYGRAKQDGLGDDILSGNSLSVVGLYQAIYGINPLYNRFYLDPHLTPELAGTQLKYNFRDKKLTIDLQIGHYSVADENFKIGYVKNFGFYSNAGKLLFFEGNAEQAAMSVTATPGTKLALDVKSWDPAQLSWTQSAENSHAATLNYQLGQLEKNKPYSILVNNKPYKSLSTDSNGKLEFKMQPGKGETNITIARQ